MLKNQSSEKKSKGTQMGQRENDSDKRIKVIELKNVNMQWIKINESKANVLKNSKTARKLFVKLKNKSGRHESLMAEKERNDHSRSVNLKRNAGYCTQLLV